MEQRTSVNDARFAPRYLALKGRPARPRRASVNRGGPLRRVVALASVVGLVALLVWLFVDGMFYVSNADITGLRYSSASEVYRQSGIDGYSIFWINGRDVAGRWKRCPTLKRLRAYSLPNEVRIAVEERDPVAVWKVGGRDFWVDIEGITMPVASQVDGMPVLWDLDGSTVIADGRVDRELIAAVRSLKCNSPTCSSLATPQQRSAVSDAHRNHCLLRQTGWARPAG